MDLTKTLSSSSTLGGYINYYLESFEASNVLKLRDQRYGQPSRVHHFTPAMPVHEKELKALRTR